MHPVAVAAHRVDFAVVRQHAERMRERPRRKRVRTVPLVVDAKRGFVVAIAKIDVEFLERRRDEQSFVYDRPRGEGGDVDVLDAVVRGVLFDFVAREKKSALVIVVAQAPGPANERLLHPRHRELGLVAEHAEMNRYRPPAKQKQSALRQHLLGDRLGAGLRIGVVVRQKDEADSKVAVVVEVMAELGHLGSEYLVRDLRQDARAVAGLCVGVERTAVREVAERLQSVTQDLVRALPADVRDEPSAARVVIVHGIVERPLPARPVDGGLVEAHAVKGGQPRRTRQHLGRGPAATHSPSP